jgi:hypothetical protein
VLLVIALSALLIGAPTPAATCSCEYVAPLDARNRADAVLSGRVRSVAEPIAWPRFEATFPFIRLAPEPGAPIALCAVPSVPVVSVEVATVWKGQIPSMAELRSQNPAMDMCGAYFAPATRTCSTQCKRATGCGARSASGWCRSPRRATTSPSLARARPRCHRRRRRALGATSGCSARCC